MAWLIKLGTPRHPSEAEAQLTLKEALPRSWYITTNIKEYHFGHLNRQYANSEIDSVLICPFGIFILDFKNDAGDITPNIKANWTSYTSGGSRQRRPKNPFEQAQ